MDPDVLALGAIWYVAFLLSSTCHEAAHALVAKLGGDPTAYHGGQVSLNPIPHVMREPFGMVVVPLLSYATGGFMIGWASAPYDPYWSQRHPKRASWMAVAGPAANFSLALLAGILMRAGLAAGAFQLGGGLMQLISAPGSPALDGAATFLGILFWLNVLLGTFNLMPVPPLDGYKVLGIFTSESLALRMDEWARSMGAFAIIGLIVAWQLFDYIYGPVMMAAMQVLFFGYTR